MSRCAFSRSSFSATDERLYSTRRRLRAPHRFLSLTPTTTALVVGWVAFAARYVLTGAIENDHFITLARALQILYGDWPVRDFEDPGTPLAYLISTTTAMLFGPSLLVNVLLCVLFLAITSGVTYLLAVRATGTTAAGAVAAVLTIAIYPRLYNTTKVIVPVVAIWLAWRYADAPRRRGLAALAWPALFQSIRDRGPGLRTRSTPRSSRAA